MITIVIPEWLVWIIIAMWIVQAVLNGVTAALTRKNREASRELTHKLMELAKLRAGND